MCAPPAPPHTQHLSRTEVPEKVRDWRQGHSRSPQPPTARPGTLCKQSRQMWKPRGLSRQKWAPSSAGGQEGQDARWTRVGRPAPAGPLRSRRSASRHPRGAPAPPPRPGISRPLGPRDAKAGRRAAGALTGADLGQWRPWAPPPAPPRAPIGGRAALQVRGGARGPSGALACGCSAEPGYRAPARRALAWALCGRE